MRARLAHGREQVVRARLAVAALVRLLDEVGEHLGIGVAREAVTAALELLAQLGEVLDDAVMDDGDAAVAARVRVRVGHGGAAVRRPARVADAARRVAVEVLELGFEAGDLAHTAEDVESRAVAPLERDARGVVPAVLEALEAPDEDVLRLLASGITNDSAHGRILSRSVLGRSRSRVREVSAAAWARV